MAQFNKKQKLTIFKDKPDEEKKKLLLQMISQAQAADVAKTRIRLSLRENDQENIERIVCPEIYANKQIDNNTIVEKEENKNELKVNYSFFGLIILLVIISIGFGYIIYKDFADSRFDLKQDITILKECNKRTEETFRRIENIIFEYKEDIKDNVDKIRNLETKVSIIEQVIKDNKNNVKH